jgi:hypothetical protein
MEEDGDNEEGGEDGEDEEGDDDLEEIKEEVFDFVSTHQEEEGKKLHQD